MHTKEELTKKKAQSSEQLDLVETITSDDKVRHKRRWVIGAIIFTIGLSFSFWLYRTLLTTKFSLPSLPALSLPKNTQSSLESQITQTLGPDASKWQVAVSTD